MLRRTRKVKVEKTQPTLTENEPQPTLPKNEPQPTSKPNEPLPTLTDDEADPEKEPTKGRDANGKFTAGNSGGPGNPHARHCARMLEIFRNTISEEDFIRVVRKLLEKAEAGDTSAAKILLSYVVGKPLAAPHPDSIDRDEWDHFQNDSMNQKELALVMNGLPTHVGNDMARVALPIMTDTRMRDLAKQLLKGCPGAKRGEKPGARGEERGEGGDERGEQTEPISNGELGEHLLDPTTLHTPPATTGKPIANGELKAELTDPSTRHAPPTTPAERSTNHASRSTTQKPISNGKKDKSKPSTRHAPPTTPAKRSTTPRPSTRHAPPSTPRTNGKKMYGKKMKKKGKALWLLPLAKQLEGG
jgi:hypothetical protein